LASTFGAKPDINFYIGMRGNADIDSFSSMPDITVFPSKWLYTSDGFNRVVRMLQSRNTEIIHVCNAHTMAPLFGFPLAKALGAHCVVDFHDINSILCSMMGHDENRNRSEANLQRLVAEYADHCCFVSDTDIETFKREECGTRINASHVPAMLSNRCSEKEKAETNNALFIGNLDYPPNLRSAKYIIEVLATDLASADVHINIVGPGGNGALPKALPPNVTLHGAVDNPFSIAKSCAFGLAPLEMGSGMKVKLLDYARFGLAVISTKLGVDGYGEAEGARVVELEDFACTIREMIANPRATKHEAERFLAFCEKNFSGDRVLKRLDAVFCSLSSFRPKVKPEVVVNEDFSFRMEGVDFPPPLHLMEARYKTTPPFRRENALLIHKKQITELDF
jgi:glycosyltransferase involved in cell wall biosynthesis